MSTDRADLPDDHLRFPAGRFEGYLLSLIYATQLATVAGAALAFGFWILAAPSDEGHWYPEILALSLGLIVFAYLLTNLYHSE